MGNAAHGVSPLPRPHASQPASGFSDLPGFSNFALYRRCPAFVRPHEKRDRETSGSVTVAQLAGSQSMTR